jgi:hypothetical protein
MDSTVASPPALPAGHPFSNISTAFFYWAANTWAFDTSHAWTVDFVTGGAQSFASKSDSGILVWCVRGGQGIDLQ